MKADETEKESTADVNSSQRQLRDTFVEMLFALAVAEVATHLADVLDAISNAGNPATLTERWPAISHLALALVLIATSWVGWMRSKSPGRSLGSGGIFSLWFVGLLADVVLVVVYFIMARQVELIRTAADVKLGTPDAVSESKLLLIVFLIYIGWDILTDVMPKGCVPRGADGRVSFFKTLGVSGVSIFASLVCTALVAVAWWQASTVTKGISVILIDIALVAVVLLFRTLKPWENPLARIFRVQDCEPFRVPRESSRSETIWRVIASAAYCGGLLAARWLG